MEKRKKDGSCVRDEITGDGFPVSERADFSQESNKDTVT